MNDATEPIDVEFQKIKFEMSVDVKYILEYIGNHKILDNIFPLTVSF